MNRDQKILVILIIIIVLIASAFGVYAFSNKDKNECKTKENDSIKIKREFEKLNNKKIDNSKNTYEKVILENDNPFVYINENQAIDIINNKSGIILFGYASCPYTRSIISILSEVASDMGISKIYYLDISGIRDSYKVSEKKVKQISKGTDGYNLILKSLDKYLSNYSITDSKGKIYSTDVKRIYSPTLIVVKNGEVIGFHEGTVKTHKLYQTLIDKEKEEIKNIYINMFSTYMNNMCTNKGC